MTAATRDARRAALFAGRDDAALTTALVLLDAVQDLTAEEVLVTAWTCSELEERHPEIVPVLNAWLDSLATDAPTPSYTAALLAALSGDLTR